ncbi:anaphase-promoting complex subunit cdc27 [Yamadazyma tenuis]|uniref:anaphase-promoting complex subunit cdc27 n=1 Tax=Candida tenuis TaxID=2315449 RepID=UPI00279B873E|nr:anaphase-promoting complex subunit cdc27 [Yamadazyma tenuis]
MQEQPFVIQHLRSIIIHSLDTFNYTNAEFAGERLLAQDPEDLDSIYLYCLVLFHQKKYKTCYNRLINLEDHLGCSYLFGKSCLHLKKYKEGVYQLMKVNYLYNDSTLKPHQTSGFDVHHFSSSFNRFNYESNRNVLPDASGVYHLLGDLYNKTGDIKNSSLNYSYCLKFNQFDFEAFQKLCKLGVNVKVKALYKPSSNFNVDFDLGQTNFDGQSPFQNQNTIHQTPVNNGGISIHPDDSFNLSTPRMKTTSIPNAPLRKSVGSHTNQVNNHSEGLSKFEFTKPKLTLEKKKESTYSKITSRLISQPASTSSDKERLRSSLKRNNSNSNIHSNGESSGLVSEPGTIKSVFTSKEIESSESFLLQLYVVLARSYKCFSKYDCYKAIRILESLPEAEKNSPWVLSKLGRLHYEIVNYKQSEAFFVKLRMMDRTRLEDMEYYSTLLWHLHKKIELTYLANELFDLDSKNAITWCVIGNLFSLNREPDEAIKCFTKAVKFDENFSYAYTLKGHEYFGNDNYEMALENFRISLVIDPRHYNALYGIGMVYINLGDYQKADYHFRRAVSINPINIILICCVGMVLEKMGKKNLALRQYELANKLQPLNPLPIFKKAQLLFTMQQFQQSLQLFEVLKDLAPDEASVHFLLGQLYNIQDNKHQAIKEFTIALNLDPKGNYLIREAMESLQEKS